MLERTRPRRSAPLLWLCLALVVLCAMVPGCESRLVLGAGCTASSECTAPHVCRLGRCRAECTTDRDCSIGLRCLLGPAGGACAVTAEQMCTPGSCPSGTVCLEGSCATECATAGDCPGGPCLSVLVDGLEVHGCGDVRDTSPDAGAPDAAADAGDGADAGAPLAALDIACGPLHCCALRSDGRVYCWGGNGNGELGDGLLDHGATCDTGVPTDFSAVPVEVVGIGPADPAIALDEGCAVLRSGGVRCWGPGNFRLGAFPPGSAIDTPTPVVVTDGTGRPVAGMRVVGVGQHHALAAGALGAFSWGSALDGALAIEPSGLPTPDRPPTAVSLPPDIADLGGGRHHACALDSAGAVYCWGGNPSGELGLGTRDTSAHAVPVPVVLPGPADELGVGFESTCARVGPDVYCWGFSDLGELGRAGATCSGCADPSCSACPARVAVSGPVRTFGVSWSNGCAVLEASGEVECWGAGGSGQLGTGTANSDRPVFNPYLHDLREIDGTGTTLCAIDAGGRVLCWGDGLCGQTGDPALPAVRYEPYLVPVVP